MRALAPASLAAMVTMLGPASATGQEPRVAAVLAVEDDGYPGSATTERLGVALYSRFLRAGRYASVTTVVGRQDANERLAAAIRDAARDHDLVDVVCSVHTTTREPEAWARLVPPSARKLRLVYSTACYGNDEERAAWAGVGARAVVTHVGINNPLVALPFILGRWQSGAPLGPAVSDAWAETQRSMHLLLSFPGVSSGGVPDVGGSRPVVLGDAALTARAGHPGWTSALPRELVYDRARGGPVGLLLRALDGFEVGKDEVRTLLERVQLPVLLPDDAMAQVKGVAVEQDAARDGLLALGLRRSVDVPFEGMTLRVGQRVTLTPGRLDPQAGRLDVRVTGLTIKKGIFRVRLSRLSVTRSADGGHRVTARAALWGFIPLRRSFELGGSAPAPIASEGPIFLPTPTTPGLTGAIANVAR